MKSTKQNIAHAVAVLALVFSLSATPTISAHTYMLNRADYDTGIGPRTLALGDLNGDGRMDMVTGNPGHNPYAVSVLLGQPGGTFAPFSPTHRDYIVGGGPSSIENGASLQADVPVALSETATRMRLRIALFVLLLARLLCGRASL